MSPGCTYRSGECDEKASWQAGSAGNTPRGPDARRHGRHAGGPRSAPGSPRRTALPPITAAPRSRGHPCLSISDDPARTCTASRCSAPSPSLRTAHPCHWSRTPGGSSPTLPCTAARSAARPSPPTCGRASGRRRRLLDEALAAAGAPLADGRVGRHRRPRPRRRRRPRRGDGPGPRAGHRPRPPRSVPADLPVATALLSADVLPGWTEAWLAIERERFRQIRLNALEELSPR